jgi:hypothetical protein
VPVFLLYAGILHAIGLALLLPMLITLPGPGGKPAPRPAPAPEIAPIDVIVLPPPQTLTDAGPEHTSALPPAPPARKATATQPAEPAKAGPSQAQPRSAETPVREEIEAEPNDTLSQAAPAAEAKPAARNGEITGSRGRLSPRSPTSAAPNAGRPPGR